MKKISRILVLFILILLLCIGTVKALGFNFTATPSTTTVEPGETVTINFNISNIDAGELGINTIEAFLDYDKNVFETVSSSDFAGANNWSITYNGESGENEGKFVAVILQDGVTENQSIGSITLKVKDSALSGQTQVTLTGIKTNDGTTEIPSADQTIKINVASPEPVVDEPEPEPEPEKPTTSPDPIPQTGENAFIIIIVSLGVLAIATISFIMYRKMKDIK